MITKKECNICKQQTKNIREEIEILGKKYPDFIIFYCPKDTTIETLCEFIHNKL